MGIIDWAIQVILDIITAIGYLGIFILMALESMCLPVPSEIVVPFGGYLAYQGTFNFWGVVLASTFGCTFGSALAYWIGLKGGRPFICKYGHYIRLNEGHLDLVEGWFKKWGATMVFVTRLLPVVRTFISLPVGMAKYRFDVFIILTTIGSFIWCLILGYLGFVLGPAWGSLDESYKWLTVIVLLAFGLVFVWWYFDRRRKARSCELEKKE
jgi:membrane protein DedA with SNARE-associated domain